MDVSRLLGVLTATIKSVQNELNQQTDSRTGSATAINELTPFMQNLNKLRIMLLARKDDEHVRDRIRTFFTNLDAHLMKRIQTVAAEQGAEDVISSLRHVLPGQVARTEHKDPTMEFNLLKSVTLAEQELPEKAPAVDDGVKVPDSVLASIKKRMDELKAKIDQKIERKEKDWAYYVPQTATPRGDEMRLRIGDDRAVEMLEMLHAYLSKKVTPIDLKYMIVKFQSYDNLTRSQVPDDVLKFMLVASQWGAMKPPAQEYKEVK